MKRGQKAGLVAVALIVAASAATFARYQSLDPCAWMEQDRAERSAFPPLVVRAQIRAEFLLDGITEPGLYDCLTEWWALRREGQPEAT